MTEYQEVNNLKKLGVIPSGTPVFFGIKFLKACERLDLSPYTGEYYMIERFSHETGSIYIMIAGINGLRRIAIKTGEYTGCSEPVFDDMPSSLFKNKFPNSCTVSVSRKNKLFTQTIFFREYAPKLLHGIWEEKPCVMISKVCKAMAIREAFPETNGLYIEEELSQLEIKPLNHNQKKINIGVDYILNKIKTNEK